MMTKDDLARTVAVMRELGVRRLCMDGELISEIELFAPDSAPAVPAEAAPLTAAEVDKLLGDAPAGDDLLEWSVSGPLPSEVRDASRPPQE